MRKTLAKGGRGDKMATALMNHIEKEKKKLSVVSSLIPSSTRRKAEYGVHLPSPVGTSTHRRLPRPAVSNHRSAARYWSVARAVGDRRPREPES